MYCRPLKGVPYVIHLLKVYIYETLWVLDLFFVILSVEDCLMCCTLYCVMCVIVLYCIILYCTFRIILFCLALWHNDTG